MKPIRESAATEAPSAVMEINATYTVSVVAELSGVATEQIHYFQEIGLVSPVAGTPENPAYDDESVRLLRRLEHLRSHYGIRDAGLRLFLNLLNEVEELRRELRQMQRHL